MSQAPTTRRAFFQPPQIRDAIRGVSLQARAIFDEIVRASGRSGWTSIRQAELASLLKVSERTVRRYERALEEAGLIYVGHYSHWIRKDKGGTSRILVPAVSSKAGLRPPSKLMGKAKRIRLAGREVFVRAISGLREAFRALIRTYRTRMAGILFSKERLEARSLEKGRGWREEAILLLSQKGPKGPRGEDPKPLSGVSLSGALLSLLGGAR